MRKIALVVAFLFLATPLFVSAKPARSPHEDPSTAVTSIDLAALLTSYTGSFSAVSSGQYQNARKLLDELQAARIPSEYRNLANRFSPLASQLIDKMDDASEQLDQTTTLMATNQFAAARAHLDSAASDIREAQSLLGDIDIATSAMKSALGTLAAPVVRQVESAYGRLLESSARLGSLLSDLDSRQQFLSDRQTAKLAQLTPTTLTVNVAPSEVFVGDRVTVSGTLSGTGPLPGREVILRLGEDTKTTTLPDGSFTAMIDIPYIYSSQVLQALYLPAGADSDIYLAARLPVVIKTDFYPTTLDVYVPARTHPGLPTPIVGKLSSGDESIDRTLEIYLDDALLTARQVKNAFNFVIIPPPDTPPGKHKLSFTAPADKRHAGAVKELAIDFSLLPITADIILPPIIILPWQAEASGRVTSAGSPVPEETVQFQFGGAVSSAATDANGNFTVKLNTPFGLTLLGSQEMTVTVTPTQPQYEPLVIKRKIFTVNSINLFLMLLIAASLSFFVYRRSRTPVMVATSSRQLQTLIPESQPPSKTPFPEYGFAGLSGVILSAYFSAAGEIAGLTGIASGPAMTLREFLKTVTPKITRLEKPFSELSVLAEIALYSLQQPDAEAAYRAEELAGVIKKEVHRAPP